ncbi:hypothetical protein PENSPDRAFT_680985 [Peniophora sp. CONT]|nr:hypothetical protein PENSPDRAFT_680985 [Peniophora sp. CONT]
MQQQHELHVRRLLDERAERAGLSPVAPSEYVGGYETPSMYSARSPRAPFDDPNASELNLDDDEDTYPHPHSPPMSAHADDEDTDSPHDLEEEEEQEQRMSMLGPKMRFHSPAPWELDADPITEQDEQDDDTRSFVSKRGKPGFIKSLGLGGSSKTSRPSTDSSRSSGREKKSFETTSSYVSAGGALHALAQASMSSTSLTHTPSPASATARSKFPLSRPRTRTQSGGQHNGLRLYPPAPVSSMPSPSSAQASPVGYHTRSSSPAPSAYSTALSRTDTRTSSRPTSPLGQEFIHPYANPEVSSPYRDSFQIPPVPSARAATLPVTPEGNITGGYFGLQAPRSASPTGSVAPSIAPSITSGAGDYSSRRQGSGLNGRTISGPMPMDTSGGTLHSAQSYSSMRARTSTRERDPKFPQQMPAGFAELPSSPNFNLISLQEAQAQAQARTRSATAQSSSQAPFLQEDPSSRSNHNGGRSRMRSTSAGAKVREDASAVSPVAGGPPPKLKHKKSGFMRLFNKGDEPPPVPPLIYANHPVPPSEYSLSSMSSSTNMSATSPYTPRPQARVPVPQLSPEDERPPLSTTDGPPSAGSGRRRQPPPLAIVPPHASNTHLSGSLFSSQEGNPSRTTLMPERSSPRMEEQQRYERVPRGRGEPSSAPPGAPQFPSLSLRPVSTVFSAHFAGTLGGDFGMDLDRDASHSSTTSGRSPTSAMSPVTPGFPPSYGGGIDPTRSGSDSGALIMDANSDDPNAVIAALQAQITGARKAWQRQIWELEGQVRDLRAEMEEMRAKERSGEACAFCGRGGSPGYDEVVPAHQAHDMPRKGSLPSTPEAPTGRGGVVNRPRARTGVGGRFGAAT